MKTAKSSKAHAKKRPAAKAKPGQPPAPKLSRTHQPEGMELEEWQRLLRIQFGEKQDFRLENIGGHPVFSDFSLINPASGGTYRIAIRGDRPGDNYCSCPDFRINALGTCKHIAFTLARLKSRRGAKKLFRDGFTPPYSEIYLSYGLRREVRFRAGTTAPDKVRALARRYFDEHGVLKERRFADFTSLLDETSKVSGHELRCYDDVMEFVAHRQDAAHRLAMVDRHLPEGIAHRSSTPSSGPGSIPTSGRGSSSRRGPGGRSLPTTWGSARPCRPSPRPS